METSVSPGRRPVLLITRRAATRLLAAGVLALLVMLAAAGAASAAGRCGTHPWCDTALGPDERASLLLGEMTADEKAAFLGGDDVTGVIGGEGTHTGTQLGVPRLDLPTIYYSDGPQGPRAGEATALPGPMALAATFDRETARTYGAEVGNEVWLKGNDVVFAPTINVMRTPFGGRTFEGYGEDPFLISRTAVNWIRGAQSEGVIADVKHYAVNNQEGIGAAPVGVLGASGPGSRLLVDARVDERTLREVYLRGFEAAVKEGHAGTVMCAYNQVNGQYACEQQHLLQEILEREWGFKGYVLSDYGATHNTIASLNNGLDFEPFPGAAYNPQLVQGAVAGGQVSQETVDGHVRRILRTLFAYGAFDHPTIPYDDSKIDQAGHKKLAGEFAERAATLLRNKANALPLPGTMKRIALIGSDADTFKNRGGSAGITPFSVTTPREAITERAGAGVQVTYDDGSDTDAAVADAKAADVAIVFASDSSIEGKDKTCLNLTCPTDATLPSAGKDIHDQDALIEAVAAAKPNTVVVLETGGPVLTPWRDKVAAILEAWDPGEDGGTAIARVLFGDVEPGGRLPVTFPNSVDDLPTAGDPEKYPGVGEQVQYKEGVLVGYRWFDAHKLPVAYPFGFGLSYTSFAVSGLKVKPAGDGARVTVTVKNTGKRPGTGVPQVYLGLPQPSDDVVMPPSALAGFKKVALAPGKSKKVSLTIARRDLSYWNVSAHDWALAAGCATVKVGFSSRDLPLQTGLPIGNGRCTGASLGGCRDRVAPVSRFAGGGGSVSRRRLHFNGRSRDAGCKGADGVAAAGKVARVYVSIAKVRGKGRGANCAFVTKRGTLTSFRRCRRPVLLRAHGTKRWRITVKSSRSLPRGHYRVVVRGIDRAKNKERPTKGRNIASFRIR